MWLKNSHLKLWHSKKSMLKKWYFADVRIKKWPWFSQQHFLGVIHKLHCQVFGFFDHLPPSIDIFYPSLIVNVVCEQTLVLFCQGFTRIEVKWMIVFIFYFWEDNMPSLLLGLNGLECGHCQQFPWNTLYPLFWIARLLSRNLLASNHALPMTT